MADLATHQDPKEDLWIAIRDKDSEVHNVDYMSKFSHPGGQESKAPPLLPISRAILSFVFVLLSRL
jgi:hypothetical protein